MSESDTATVDHDGSDAGRSHTGTAADAVDAPLDQPDGGISRRARSLTIGSVCKLLEREFQDISISKIRYLEDQKLLTPRRSAGGYRVYSQDDVARLRTILRLQRDEFLPLRVIRQELSAGRSEDDLPPPGSQFARATRRFPVADPAPATLYSEADVLSDTGADASLIKELAEFGLIRGQIRAGASYFDEVEREIIRAVSELARYGVTGRNLRVFRTSTERESALLEQILAPALRSRNPERRREAIDALENLAAVTSHLKHLLLVRDLRALAGGPRR